MTKKVREKKTERDLRRLEERGYVYSYWVGGKLHWALTEKGRRESRRENEVG